MPDKPKTSAVEQWILKRPAMTALCLNNAHLYAVMQLAINDDWTPEHFLEYAVMCLARINAGVIGDFAAYQMSNPPPIVMDGKEYKFINPEPLHERQSDSPRSLRREGLR